MLVDIEPEYNNFIRNSWHKFSEPTKDILKFHQKPDYTYNIVSLQSIRFLQLKLKNLETKKT